MYFSHKNLILLIKRCKMKVFSAVAVALLATSIESFSVRPLVDVRVSTTAVNGYVPDGFTPESYARFKESERKKNEKKNLGRMGPKGFKSRSFQSFQEALERGEAAHLMPVTNAKEKLRRGEIKKEDIPYMQRGGAWDNSDVKGAKQKRWLSSDKSYSEGGYKKEQSVSIFGYGQGLDWTGKKTRKGPSESVPGAAPKFAKNYKAPNVNDLKKEASGQKKKKGFFGW